MGAGTGTAARALIATQSENGAPTSNTNQAARNDSLLGSISTAAAWSGYLDINSMDSAGWTDVIDLQFVTNFRAMLLALNLNSEFVSFSEPVATGVQTISGLSGTPVAIRFISSPGGVTPGTIVGDSRYMVGMAVNAGGTLKNGILAGGANDLEATMMTRSYCRAGSGTSGDCIAGVSNDHLTINSRARVTQMASGQFQLTWDAVVGDGSRDYYAVVFYDGVHDIQTYMTETDTVTDIVFSGLPSNMTPVAGMTFSADLAAASTAGVLDVKDEWLMG
ncbi:MAG: hypothetical protein ACREXT_16620, partial [Gammaproteobacteria bacterium]